MAASDTNTNLWSYLKGEYVGTWANGKDLSVLVQRRVTVTVTTGALLGASKTLLGDLPDSPTFVALQDYLQSDTTGWSGSIDVKLWALRESTTWPPYTITVPTASSVVATQTGTDTVLVTWTEIGSTAQIERSINSGAWTALETDYQLSTDAEYEDTDLSNGQTAQYRITAKVGTTSAAATASSNTLTVDNAPYTGTWQDTIVSGSTDTTDNQGTGTTLLAKLTVTGNGTCSKVRIYSPDAGPLGAVKMALYDNASPKNTLASGSAPIAAGPGYTEITLNTTVAVTNGQVVWIAWDPQNSMNVRYLNGGASNAAYRFETYAGFPTNPLTVDGTLTRTYAASAYIY